MEFEDERNVEIGSRNEKEEEERKKKNSIERNQYHYSDDFQSH